MQRNNVKLQDGLEKLINFVLKRTFDKVNEKENHHLKSQHAIANEGFGRKAICAYKPFGIKGLLNFSDKLMAKTGFPTCS